MADILSQAHWQRRTVQIGTTGRTVSMELRRLNALSAAPFLRSLARARAAASAVWPESQKLAMGEEARTLIAGRKFEELSREEAATLIEMGRRRSVLDAEANAAFVTEIPEEMIRRLWSGWVRSIEAEIDGEAVTDAATLAEVCDLDLLCKILLELEDLCSLSRDEGKGSPSPSTSAVDGTQSGGSPVPSTSGEGGGLSSTATETPAT